MSKYRPYQIGGIFLIIVFIIGGIWSIFFHDLWAYSHPFYKFIYGGLFSLWDAVLGLIIGAYIGWKHYKKKTA